LFRKRSLRLLVASFAVLSLAAACSSDDDSSSGGDDDEQEEAAAPQPDCVAEPTGEPILIGTISNIEGPGQSEGVVEGSEAAAESINCEGGVQGRPVEILPCNGNTALDPNNPTTCARDAVEAGVIASAGNFVSDAAATTIFEDAGLPVLGFPLSAADITSPVSFPLTAGAPGTLAGNAAQLYDAGFEDIGLVILDVPGADLAASFADNALAERGTELSTTVKVPVDPSADVAPLVAQATGDSDALIIALTGDSAAQFILGARQSGFTGGIGMTAITMNEDLQEQLGDEIASGIDYLGTTFPASADAEGIDAFNADMAAYQPDSPRNEFAINSWQAVRVIADVLEQAETVDAAALLAGLEGYTVELGVAPPLTFEDGGAFGLPRLFTENVLAQAFEDGELVQVGEFFNPLEP